VAREAPPRARRISFSSLRIRFSLRSRDSLLRSSLVRAPGGPLPAWTLACLTHLCRTDLASMRPSRRTSGTAPALNSSVNLRRVRRSGLVPGTRFSPFRRWSVALATVAWRASGSISRSRRTDLDALSLEAFERAPDTRGVAQSDHQPQERGSEQVPTPVVHEHDAMLSRSRF
jgi:hypothetical protein